MDDLLYRIGALDINTTNLKLSEREEKERLSGIEKIGNGFRFLAHHKFIVREENKVVSIFVSSEGYRHSHVAGKFGIADEEIIGGGNCYINRKEELVLDDFSGDYSAIPKNAANAFAELIRPELIKKGLEVIGIMTNTNESKLNPFWNKFF